MATVIVLYFCLALSFPNFNKVEGGSHWVVTEDGRIQAQLDSMFNMRRPYDFMSLLKQGERAEMLDGLKEELLERKAEIDKNEDKDTGLEQRFYKTDSDCVIAEKPLPEFDLYISTVLPLENKGIRPEDHINFNANPSTMPIAPDCTKIGVTLDFSMHAFEHLQGMKERANLSGSQELGLKNAIAHRDNVDAYGHLVYQAMLKNNTSWVLYNMAAFYWRIKGRPYHVVECVRRALHFSPRMHKDVALISLANVLHRAHYSNEAAVVVHAAIDVSKELNVNHFTLGNIYAVLRDYNKSVICFENTLSIQPDFEAAAKRKHAVKCHAKLEDALEKQHKSLQRTLDDLKDYQKKHTHWQQQQERLQSEQASPDTKMEQRLSYEEFMNREVEVSMGYGEFCKEVAGGIWCGWDKKHVYLTEEDFQPVEGLKSHQDMDEGDMDVNDYSVPKHPPRYSSKHPPIPEALQKLSFRQSDWPSKEECDTHVVKFPALNEFPTTYLSPENKGYEVKPLLAEAQGLTKEDEHPLPWYPPTCAGLTDIPEGPRSYDHIQSVKERREIPLKLYDTSMRQVLLDHVEARDMAEAEVGQRIMTALKKKIGPSWVLYNLAGLYWRIMGNSYHGVECVRRSLYYAPDEYRDVPLVNLANILYKWGRVEDAIVVMRDAIAINDLEPDTHFFLGNLLAATGNLSGSIHHYEEALLQNSLHKEALDSLRIIKCYQKFHRSAQSSAPKQSPGEDKCNNPGSGLALQGSERDSKVFCKNENGQEMCMLERSHVDGCNQCKQMCSITPVKMDGCSAIPASNPTVETEEKCTDLLETLRSSGVSEEIFHQIHEESMEECANQENRVPLMPVSSSMGNNPLDDPDIDARLEDTVQYYQQKGVCSGEDCNKLMIQCFTPVSQTGKDGAFFLKNQPLYVFRNPDNEHTPLQTCNPVGLPPSRMAMLANMPMESDSEKPHTKLDLVDGEITQTVLFNDNYEDIEYEPDDCIIFNHGEKTPGCERDEFKPFDLNDPSSVMMHPINHKQAASKTYKSKPCIDPESNMATQNLDLTESMTTEELSEILDKLQRDLEAEKQKYEESKMLKRLEERLDALRYQHADSDYSRTTGLVMTDEDIIRTDPDPTRNIKTLPNTQWPQFKWCKDHYRKYNFKQFESTWVCVSSKGIDITEHLDFSERMPLSATPICDASLLSEDLPMDQIPQLMEPQTLQYKPEGGLKEAFQGLNTMASESVQEVGTRIAYALQQNPRSWVLASLATLHWRVTGHATEAITCAKVAYQFAPDHAKDIPLLSLANILHRSGHLHEALKLTNAALEHAPDMVALHFTTANLYAALEDWAKATQFYQATLALQSTLLQALERLLVIQCDKVLSNPGFYRDHPPTNSFDPEPVLQKLRHPSGDNNTSNNKKKPSRKNK